MDLEGEPLDDQPSSPLGENPMAYLGLRRRNAGETDSDASPVKKDPGIALNLRGIPARKRKKNSLIYGADDLVNIPIKSPKKRGPKVERKKGVSPTKQGPIILKLIFCNLWCRKLWQDFVGAPVTNSLESC